MAEMRRVLAPGGVALIGGEKIVKPRPKGMDEWQQHYHGADNNAVANDGLVGPPRHFPWIAEPQWSRSHLCLPSINSLVSAGGRLFSIEDQASAEHQALPGKFALICRDAFNGIELWRKKLDHWFNHMWPFKSGPLVFTRRLVVKGDSLFAALEMGGGVSILDANTCELLHELPGT